MISGYDKRDRLYHEADYHHYLRARRRTFLRNAGCIVVAWIALIVMFWTLPLPVRVQPSDQPKTEAMK